MKTIFKYSLAVLSGLLLLLSFPPFDLEFLAWIALVPVLVAISYEREFRFNKVAWLGLAAMAVVYIPHWFDPWHTEMEGWLPASWSWVGLWRRILPLIGP